MKQINIREAKAQFSKLLGKVEREGESFWICKGDRPIADLIPHFSKDRLTPRPIMRRIGIDYDPIEPLTEEEWPTARHTNRRASR